MCLSRPVLVAWRRIIGLLAVLLAAVLLQGCSAVKLAYNNAPELAYWWIDGYADLDDAQSLKVREELARLQQWHRANELPRIAELLQRTRQVALADATPEQVCTLFAEVRKRFDAVVAQAEAPTVAVAMTMRPAQLAHLEARFAKGNTEWRQEWMAGTAAERAARRLKSAVERSEQFYGTLEERQLAVLRNAIAQSSFDPALSYAERQRRQRDVLQALREGTTTPPPGVAQATQLFRATVDRSITSPDAAYRAYAERAIAESCRTFAQLHNSTTPEQRERAVRRLAAYERDARELATRP
ncbi:MAG: hypothetical protein JNM97_19275 [Rhodoferax sp.]|jgi:hypothetical protein|nr:hypothetical protein [Rhodoferax sp.]